MKSIITTGLTGWLVDDDMHRYDEIHHHDLVSGGGSLLMIRVHMVKSIITTWSQAMTH